MTFPTNTAITHDWFNAWNLLYDSDVKFNLVVTSPPYYNARKYGKDWDYFKSPEEWLEFCVEMISTLGDVMKKGGVIWWNTGSGYENNRRLTVIERLIIAAEDRGIYQVEQIPWTKTSFVPKSFNNRPYAAWEQNIVFSKEPELARYYVDNVREPYAESTLKRYKYTLKPLGLDESGESVNEQRKVGPNPLGKSPPNYLHKNVDLSKRDHPAPMAAGIASWAIRAYSKIGDLVLDPMCGYGTTLIEAKRLDRNYLGFDINEKYVKEAIKCLEETERASSSLLLTEEKKKELLMDHTDS